MMNRDDFFKANFTKSLYEKVKAQIEKNVEQHARYTNKDIKNMIFKQVPNWIVF